jgi:hypothetical protein
MLVQIQYYVYVLTFKITRSKLSFLGSSKKEINIRDFAVFTRVGQGSNLGPTLRYLLTWAKVRTKDQLFGIYSRGPRFEPRAYPAVFTGWAKVRIKYQPCSIYSRGLRFEPKKGLPCGIYSSGPKFELRDYRTLQYLLAACSRFEQRAYLQYLAVFTRAINLANGTPRC